MAQPEWTNEEFVPYKINSADSRKFRDNRLPGTPLFKSSNSSIEIIVQEFKGLLTQLGVRIIHALKKISIVVKERRPGFRIQAVLKGELNITYPSGQKERVRAGQYHVTNLQNYKLDFKKDSSCNYIVSYCPPELIRELNLNDDLKPMQAKQMPPAMSDLIHKLLHNPFNDKLRPVCYSNFVRELLLLHLVVIDVKIPGDLTDDDIAAAHHADQIIGTDLSQHYTIRTLARMVHTNVSKLKKSFQLIFGMGVFERLCYKRMEHAKYLMATTSLPVKTVAYEAGYNNPGSFITAFGRTYGMSPLKWRVDNSGNTSW